MVYMSVHAANPGKTNVSVGELINRLLRYKSTIIGLLNQGIDWAKYDRRFRLYIEGLKIPNFQYKMHDLVGECRRSIYRGAD